MTTPCNPPFPSLSLSISKWHQNELQKLEERQEFRRPKFNPNLQNFRAPQYFENATIVSRRRLERLSLAFVVLFLEFNAWFIKNEEIKKTSNFKKPSNSKKASSSKKPSKSNKAPKSKKSKKNRKNLRKQNQKSLSPPAASWRAERTSSITREKIENRFLH